MKVVRSMKPPQGHPGVGLTRLACSKVRKGSSITMFINELKHSVWCIDCFRDGLNTLKRSTKTWRPYIALTPPGPRAQEACPLPLKPEVTSELGGMGSSVRG